MYDFQGRLVLLPTEKHRGDRRMTGETRPCFLFLLSEKGHEFNRREIMEILKTEGTAYPAALDWCSVHNFHAESRPRILSLPAGFGPIFRSDMENFINQARLRLRTVFASKDYQLETESLRMNFDRQELDTVQPICRTLSSTPYDEVNEEQGPDEQGTGRGFREVASFTAATEGVHAIAFSRPEKKDTQLARDKIRLLKKRCAEELGSLTERKAMETIAPLMLDLKKKYHKNWRVLAYLEEVGEDILENLQAFTLPVGNDCTSCEGSSEQLYSPYAVQVLVTRGSSQGTPLVFARDVGQTGLFGSVSDETDPLSSRSDFTLVRAGALHEANGGFLLIEASWILRHFHLWEQLKAAVIRRELGQICTDPRGGMFTSRNVVPEAIPLLTTVLVTGSSSGYSILSAVDPDFSLLAGKPIVKYRPFMEETPGEAASCNPGEIPSGKPLDVSARKAILSLFRDPGISRNNIEDDLRKISEVINKAQGYPEAGQVTARHVIKAVREIHPEIVHPTTSVLLQRQTAKPDGPGRTSPGPKALIESVKCIRER